MRRDSTSFAGTNRSRFEGLLSHSQRPFWRSPVVLASISLPIWIGSVQIRPAKNCIPPCSVPVPFRAASSRATSSRAVREGTP